MIQRPHPKVWPFFMRGGIADGLLLKEERAIFTMARLNQSCRLLSNGVHATWLVSTALVGFEIFTASKARMSKVPVGLPSRDM